MSIDKKEETTGNTESPEIGERIGREEEDERTAHRNGRLNYRERAPSPPSSEYSAACWMDREGRWGNAKKEKKKNNRRTGLAVAGVGSRIARAGRPEFDNVSPCGPPRLGHIVDEGREHLLHVRRCLGRCQEEQEIVLLGVFHRFLPQFLELPRFLVGEIDFASGQSNDDILARLSTQGLDPLLRFREGVLHAEYQMMLARYRRGAGREEKASDAPDRSHQKQRWRSGRVGNTWEPETHIAPGRRCPISQR